MGDKNNVKETWWGYLKAEAEKERKKRDKREKKLYRANTKAFRTPQSFGAVLSASKDVRATRDDDIV